MFQPFLRFWKVATKQLTVRERGTFQPFLRFWYLQLQKGRYGGWLLFQPFLRFWRLLLKYGADSNIKTVSTLLEILGLACLVLVGF